MDIAALDGADRFDAAQSGFGGSQGPEALPISQETFHRGVIAFDQVVSPLLVDVANAVEVRIIPVIDVADHTPIGVGFVCDDRHRPVEPHTLDRLVEKGFGSLGIPPGRQTKVDQLTVRIYRSSEVAPLAADADVGFVHVPIDAGAVDMPLGALRQFRAEFLDPAIDRRSINRHAALGKQINDILVRQRIAKVPADRAKDDASREAVVLERGSTRHNQPQKPKVGGSLRLTQQSPLNLLAAIIIYWNTKHLGHAKITRNRACLDCSPELLSHISLLGWAHILLMGEYRWKTPS